MRTAEDILTDLVAAEEAGLAHHESCDVCQADSHSKCPAGMGLAMEAIEVSLEAKMWVDARQSARIIQFPEDGPGLSVVR
jgi:hypothetical protein